MKYPQRNLRCVIESTSIELLCCWALCGLCLLVSDARADENPPRPGFHASESDMRAIQIADETMRAMGGRKAWDETRYVSWVFMGRRKHYWDKWTGDIRIEADSIVVIMNVNAKEGRVWIHGQEVEDVGRRTELVQKGYGWWINDSYWVFMPYKLKDSGVSLRYRGQRVGQDGRLADVLELTFSGVGLTPENRYEVLVDQATHLVSEWTFFRAATDTAAVFTLPWKDWRQVGKIRLCGNHGRDHDWKLAVFDSLPREVFEQPELSRTPY